MAMVWPRQKVTLFSPWTPWFNPSTVYLGFVVDNVALGQVFLQVLWFSSISIISWTLHTHSPTAKTNIILATDSNWKYWYYCLHNFHNLVGKYFIHIKLHVLNNMQSTSTDSFVKLHTKFTPHCYIYNPLLPQSYEHKLPNILFLLLSLPNLTLLFTETLLNMAGI